MLRRVCKSQSDLLDWSRYLFSIAGNDDTEYPITVSWKKGDDRSQRQNALAFKWYQEIAMQKGDMHPEETRAYCKLHFGVQIMLTEDEDFREKWYSMIKDRFSYEEKLALMLEPFDFPVTRLMGTKQMTRYLDKIRDTFTGQGMMLTMPPQD